jgi:hypothetical protein
LTSGALGLTAPPAAWVEVELDEPAGAVPVVAALPAAVAGLAVGFGPPPLLQAPSSAAAPVAAATTAAMRRPVLFLLVISVMGATIRRRRYGGSPPKVNVVRRPVNAR